MMYIEYFSDFVYLCLVAVLTIFILVLIDSLIGYLRAKTDLLNRQIEEYDYSRPKNK